MLATFVIGLREGLEAALIIGIIAAFLRQSQRPDALRKMWAGVAAAVLLCLAVGIALQLFNASLPQREQEMLECVVAAIAVVMVTYMVLWMRAHSRDLKRDLRTAASGALATGSAGALIAMAFLAVIREGFETAVFLLAAFSSALSPVQAVLGVLLGVGVAVGLGYLIYRGGITLNLSRFFRITGAVLVLVAGGLVMSTLRAAYEAGWLTVGQQPALDLSVIARPGSISESLLTGMLGIRAELPIVEGVAYLLYVVPMLLVVLWPPRRTPSRAGLGRILVATAAGSLVLAAALAVVTPAAPERVDAAQRVVLAAAGAPAVQGAPAGELTAEVTVDGSVARIAVDVGGAVPGAGTSGILTLAETGSAGATTTFVGDPVVTAVDATAAGLPTSLTAAQVADRNGGRLPVGIRSTGAGQALAITYTDRLTPTVTVNTDSGVVTAVDLRLNRSMQVRAPGRSPVPAGAPAESTLTATDASLAAGRAQLAAYDQDSTRREAIGQVVPVLLTIFALVLLAFGVPKLVRRAPATDHAVPLVTPEPVASGSSPTR
jgi:high-affinity iron transporter